MSLPGGDAGVMASAGPPALVTLRTARGAFPALVAGAPDAPPLVFLHGFPDHPPTAAAFLADLAVDHRVIAPWLRGYAPAPLAGPYDPATLVADLLAVIDAAVAPGATVDVVGHDWGAVITYAAALLAPARVRRIVTLAVPHPLALGAAMLAPHHGAAQRRASAYMALFQVPGAGHLVAARELALIDALWRRWSPGFALPPAARAALHACLAASLPAPLGYYRAIARPATARLLWRHRATVIAAPALHLHGADDGCILVGPATRPRTTEGSESWTDPARASTRAGAEGSEGWTDPAWARASESGTDPDARWFAVRAREVIDGVGHFLHVEAPREVAARVRRWLA